MVHYSIYMAEALIAISKLKYECCISMSNESENSKVSPITEDPLGIDKLSVDYDYLLYKINDYVSSIQLQTTGICRQQNEIITEGIVEGVIEKNIKEFEELLKKCEELENHFDMLDQIALIAETFKVRIVQVIHDYKELKK